MFMGIYTQSGLEKLAEIIRNCRGKEAVRAFARRNDISHRTISQLEACNVQEPEITTLAKIAPALGYTKEQLIAILLGKPKVLSDNLLAADIFPTIDQMGKEEIGKLIHYAVDKLVEGAEIPQ
jgi:transcriptional regulator with XRE-family HTH domain